MLVNEEKCVIEEFNTKFEEYNKNKASVSSLVLKLALKSKIVSSIEYLKWLTKFVEKMNGKFDDSNNIKANEKILDRDKRYVKLLSTFQSYLETVAHTQGICVYNENDLICIYFMYDGKFYKTELLVGQGAVSSISLLNYEPDKYVILGRELTVKEKNDRKLSHYILIRSDLKKNEEIEAISNVITIFTVNNSNNEIFEIWRDNFDMNIEFITVERIKISNSISYKKYDEVLCTSLGIMSKKEFEKMKI